MEKKVVSLKAVKFEKQYKSFYSDMSNRKYSLSCFFNQQDISKKIKIG